MKLGDYCDKYGKGNLKTLAKDSGITILTLRNASKGIVIKLYPVARAISKATGWRVTIPELCEEGRPSNSILDQFRKHNLVDAGPGRRGLRRKSRPRRKG